MSNIFVKLYGHKLVNSTLWLEPWQPRLVFMSMLAIADEDGFVDSPSVETLAYRLNLSVPDVETALGVLEAPDHKSRTKELEGRRIVRLDAGWSVVNYKKYREVRTKKQLEGAARVAVHYQNKKALAALALTRDDGKSVSRVSLPPDLRSQRSRSREGEGMQGEGTPTGVGDAPAVLAPLAYGCDGSGVEKPSPNSQEGTSKASNVEKQPELPGTDAKPARRPTTAKPRKAPDAALVALTHALTDIFGSPPPAVVGTPKREILKRIRAAVASGAAPDIDEAAWRLVTAARASGRPMPWALMDAPLNAPPVDTSSITIMSDC